MSYIEGQLLKIVELRKKGLDDAAIAREMRTSKNFIRVK